MPGGLHNPPLSGFIVATTLVVAASDSLDVDRADYECDGTADDVQIQAAHDALPAGGGKIVLLEGTYNLAAAIVITKVIELAGNGWNTILFLTNNTNTNLIEIGDGATGLNGVIIKDLAMDGNRANNAAGTTRGIEMIGAAAPNKVTRVMIDHVFVTSTHDYGICGIGAPGDGDYSVITNCEVTDCNDSGIRFLGTGIQVIGNYVHDISAGDGILVGADCSVISNYIHTIPGNGITMGNYCVAIGNYVEAATASGINPTNNAVIDGNVIWNTAGEGIDGGSTNIVSNNWIYITGDDGIRMSANCVITDNYIFNAGEEGIYIQGADTLIADNEIRGASQEAANNHNGITLSGAADRCTITDNLILDDGTKTEDGIRLEDGATQCQINSNRCYNLRGSGIALVANNDDCQIVGNYCQLNDDYGIEITAATCDRTYVKNNKLIANVTAQFLDSGTNTQLATYVVPFSDGTDPQDSGYEIDANTEMARAWLRLPPEVQQVVRMNVYARSVVTEADEMELQMVVLGGADNEAYNTHDGSIAQLDSVSANFAADDIVFWRNTEAGVLALVGGDSVEVKVLHEAAEGGNCETDAFFRTVEIEYV
ncbi:MAG: right-handed parallel beta-helix repeat-containing protein [Candidatus Peribacteraceae bacterium]|nr:right-handed parallel beta-helix repeat-containing protein [Candidatus Peribacteraceae bacterium]